MASLLTNVLEQVGQLHKADDDLIDRLNHRFTVILLVTFTAFITAKQFIGEPISCWTPSHFSKPHIDYTNSICWLKGTYYLEADKQLIPTRTQNEQFRIAYYQFVPFMLLVMAMLFYLPHMLWRNVSRHMGFDLRLIIQNIKKVSKTDLNDVALQIHTALEYNSEKYNVRRNTSLNRLLDIFRCSRRYRYHLTFLYIFVKILYMINCLCQFYLLSVFLSFPFHTFGIEWSSHIFKKVHNRTNDQFDDSKWFPRVVMCDFMVRQLGSNQHWITAQCNLPINLFNELIFLILWAWLIFLTGLTCLSFILCLISIYTNIGHSSIHKYLHMSLRNVQKDEQERFIENYLKWDGILVLQILAYNTNDIIVANLVGALFEKYSNSTENEDDNKNPYEQIKSTEHNKLIHGTAI